jgi:glycerophosphoryl diester phosphodiesterase
MGNLDKKATVSGDGIYLELVTAGVRFISTDRPIAVAQQMEQYIQQNKLTTPFIKISE